MKKLNAMAGALATLESGIRLAEWDGQTHDLVNTFDLSTWSTVGPLAGICSCGLRLDGADKAMVEKLHGEHVLEVGS